MWTTLAMSVALSCDIVAKLVDTFWVFPLNRDSIKRFRIQVSHPYLLNFQNIVTPISTRFNLLLFKSSKFSFVLLKSFR